VTARELEAAILADPSSKEAWFVYADWLQGQEDPRGELIAAQARGGDVAGLLQRHADRLLGPFAPGEELARFVQLEWQHGFWRKAQIGWPYAQDAEVSSALVLSELVSRLDGVMGEVLRHPSAKFLQELRVRLTPWIVEGEADRRDTVRLLASELRPSLRTLALVEDETDEDLVISPIELGSLQALWKALPRLERLTLHAGSLELGRIDAPALRVLKLWSPELSREDLLQIGRASLPQLEVLELRGASAEDLVSLLQGARLPRLKALGLLNSGPIDEIVEVLASSPLLAGLEVLDLEGCDLSEEVASQLSQRAHRFQHLRWLHLGESDELDVRLPLARDAAAVCQMRALLRTRAGLDEREVLEQALLEDPEAEASWEAYRRWSLKRTQRREANFRRNENHRIAKRLVKKAKDTGRGLALEELTGIRERTRFAKPQRARISGWAFSQLRTFLQYKARLAGVSLALVDPKNTSRTCAVCGYCDKKNRKNQAQFGCQACTHQEHADINAARNIRARAVVNRPMVSEQSRQQAPTTGTSSAL
jgi:IS605 OrfB family transposase